MNYNQQQQQNQLFNQLIGSRSASGMGSNTYSGQGPMGYAP
jgi:hypothetical protein